MKKHEALWRYRELNGMRECHYLTGAEHDELHNLASFIIDMYKKCVDLGDVTDEELEEWDFQ